MNRWEGLDEFVVVAETGQFTVAAERMSASSSHISHQVARLEKRLQIRLLYRSTRRVLLDEAGQTFPRHCQRLQDVRDEALRAVSDFSAKPKSLLYMIYVVAYGECSIVPPANALMVDYPQLRVDVELSNRQLDLLHKDFDLVIRLGRLSDSRLVAVRLASYTTYLCVTPEYLRRHDTPQPSAELGRSNCLIGSSDLQSFLEDDRETRHRVQGNQRYDSGQTVLDVVLRGFGLYQLPDYYVIECLRSDHLVSLLEGHQPPDTTVWVLHPRQRHLLLRVRQLVDYFKEGLTQPHPGFAREKNLR